MTHRSEFLTRRHFTASLLALPALGVLPGDALAQFADERGSLTLDARLAERRRRYRIGEAVGLLLRVNRDAQVAILNIDAADRVTVLRPNRFAPSTHLSGNRWHQFPAPGATFILRVAAPIGRNELRILASASMLLPPLLLRQGEDGFDRFDGGKPALDQFMATQMGQGSSWLAERQIRFRVVA